MTKKKILLIISFLSIILILSPTYANDCTWIPSDIYGETFEENLLKKMTNIKANSLAFSVLNGTEVFYTQGFGDQPETDIVYHLNSASKMITGTAILQLYEQGLIGLGADFNDYMPYVLKNPYYPSTTITIKHLLSHQSSLMGSMDGFENYWPSLVNGTCTFPSVIYEFFHENGSYYSDDNWENWAPGTGMSYSDVAIDILTLIVENITSTTFDTYVTDNILTPLGMTNTRFSADDYSPEKLAI
ncbi:MAG: serine hydrolase domain-containing protein, partial [Candidatus Heimdallarchaeaceae archaeon]